MWLRSKDRVTLGDGAYLVNPNSPVLVLLGVLVMREVLQLLSNPNSPMLVLVGVLVVREVLQLLMCLVTLTLLC